MRFPSIAKKILALNEDFYILGLIFEYRDGAWHTGLAFSFVVVCLLGLGNGTK
jgi:hypothetical protein